MGRISFRSPVKISFFRWIPPISNLAVSTHNSSLLVWRRGWAFEVAPAGSASAPARGPAPFWLVLGVPTFRRPVLATASHGPCHSGPNKVVALFYFNTMSPSDTFFGD